MRFCNSVNIRATEISRLMMSSPLVATVATSAAASAKAAPSMPKLSRPWRSRDNILNPGGLTRIEHPMSGELATPERMVSRRRRKFRPCRRLSRQIGKKLRQLTEISPRVQESRDTMEGYCRKLVRSRDGGEVVVAGLGEIVASSLVVATPEKKSRRCLGALAQVPGEGRHLLGALRRREEGRDSGRTGGASLRGQQE